MMELKPSFLRAFLVVTSIFAWVQFVEFDYNKIATIIGLNWKVWVNERAGWLLLGLITLYFYYVEKRHQDIPITVKNVKIKIHYEDLLGTRVHVKYTYSIRANHKDVDAIFLEQRSTSDGNIPRDSILSVVSGNGYHCGQTTDLHAVSNGWEIIQKLKKSLPRETPIFPFIKPRNIEYECSALYENSFLDTAHYENYDFIIDHRYGFKNVEFELSVPDDLKLSQCNLFLKVAHSMKEFPVHASDSEIAGYKKYCISKRVPSNQSIKYRLIWSAA